MITFTSEMREYFKYRTGYHLWLVRKWSDKIADLSIRGVHKGLLNEERDRHDEFKWVDPEYEPYVLITWSYRCKRLGMDFSLPENIKQKMHEATFHHIKNHRHHPEYWDAACTLEGLNKDDRDKPSAGQLINGTRMPDTYIASMCADWCAMSEELGTNTPMEWAGKNINVRWKFKDKQRQLIYRILTNVWKQP